MNRAFRGITLSKWRRGIIYVFAVALVLRVAFVFVLQEGFYFPDSVDYSRNAVHLVTHGEYGESYARPPIYPLFLAGIYTIVGEQIFAVRLIEALLGACLAVVIALLARRLGGDKVGVLTGLLWGVYPMAIFIVGLVYPTNLATLLLACAMLCIVPKEEPRIAPLRLVGGGILLGLTALTVPVALATILVIALWIMYWHRAHRFRMVALLLLGAMLSLAPWTARNFYLYERIVIIQPQMLQLIPTMGRARPPKDAQQTGISPQGTETINAIMRHPRLFARRWWREFRFFWELTPTRVIMNFPDVRAAMHAQDERIVEETLFTTSRMAPISFLSVGPAFLFAVIGVGAMWVHKARRAHLLLLCGTILSFAIGYSFFWGKMRYRVPVEPYILIFSAYGLWSVWRLLAQTVVRKRQGKQVSESDEAEVPPYLTTATTVGQGSRRQGDLSDR